MKSEIQKQIIALYLPLHPGKEENFNFCVSGIKIIKLWSHLDCQQSFVA